MTLFTLGLAWLAGIALARWLQPPLPVLGLLAVPALAALLLYRRERGPRLAALCALALLAGAARLPVGQVGGGSRGVSRARLPAMA
jgi:hypothetical protein